MTLVANHRVKGGGWSRVTAWLARLVRAPRPFARRARRWTLLQIAGGIVLALITLALVAVLSDAAAIVAARRLPQWLVNVFYAITDFGKSGWFLLPLGFLLLAIAAATPVLHRRAGLLLGAVAVRGMFLFAAIAVPGIVSNLLKILFGRARPYVGGVADPYLFDPLIWRAAYASLPSGHATTALSVVVAFGALWPRSRIVLWTYALVIMASRIVITAHHPSDVIAGALIGGFGALLVRDYFALRRLGFTLNSDGGVRAMPGPSWRRIKRVALHPFAQ